ncbi:MAG: MoaD/ThiS family protein [Pseudomonadota bacterium]
MSCRYRHRGCWRRSTRLLIRGAALANITLPDQLAHVAGGARELTLDVEDYRDLINALEKRFPGMRDAAADFGVAIDGQIYQDPLLEEIEPDSEVFFVPRIEGG